MSIFGTIMSKIFPPAAAATADTSQAAPPAAGAAETAPVAAAAPFDVEGALADMASKKGEQLNYHTSIVDLLKVLDLDSSLDARKKLAEELHVEAGPAGSAEENEALAKAVLQKLAESNGKLPAGL